MPRTTIRLSHDSTRQKVIVSVLSKGTVVSFEHALLSKDGGQCVVHLLWETLFPFLCIPFHTKGLVQVDTLFDHVLSKGKDLLLDSSKDVYLVCAIVMTALRNATKVERGGQGQTLRASEWVPDPRSVLKERRTGGCGRVGPA